MSRILVTPRSLTRAPVPELAPLEEAGHTLVFSTAGTLPGEEELRRLLPGCVGWLAGVEPITAHVLEAADALVAISRNGVGVDNVDLEAAGERSIAVLRATGANARGVAELTLALALATLREIPRHDAAVKSGSLERFRGGELAGRTLGVVGIGAIGRIVAELGAALGMRVLAYDIAPPAGLPAGVALAGLDDVVAASDVLTLHCPPLPDGRPLLGASELERLRPGAVLLNTARGALVDATAVLAALERGALRAYATDAVDDPAEDAALLRHPRTVATPHIGSYTDESVARATEAAVANLLAALAAGR